MALYQETKFRPTIQEHEQRITDPVASTEMENPIDRLTLPELQQEFGNFLQISLADPRKREKSLTALRTIQNESLHLVDPRTQEKTPINVSLEPIIIKKEAEQQLSQFVTATNLVRSAILMKIATDPHLSAFFESGVDPLAAEIMRGTDYTPMKAQWRFRADTATQPDGSSLYAIENNGGEPQGDRAAADAKKVVEKVLGICLDIPDNREVTIAPSPDEQLMKVMNARYRLVTGNTDHPTIGYFAWRGRSSYSEGEAKYTAQRYQERYPDAQSTQFDPRDIIDIREVTPEGRDPYYVIVCQKLGTDEQIEVDMIRRLHGEPMENMDLWREFKETYGQAICSDGTETIWDRFTTKLGPQMINPLNSYATDKKLDAMLGNEALLQHFGIWENVDQMLANNELCKALSLPRATRNLGSEQIRKILETMYPRGFMLRRQREGLYPGDIQGNDTCLSDEEITTIKENKSDWVLKRSSLVGHSGTSVHVGRAIALNELDYEDFAALDDQLVSLVTGETKENFLTHLHAADETEQKAIRKQIATTFAELEPEQQNQLQDEAWQVLVENSLNKPDSLIQQAVPQIEMPVLLFDNNENPQLQKGIMNYDLDPQSIGPGIYTYPFIRVTSAAKTNITGGYGAFGVAMSESMARSILKYAKQQELY